MAKQVQDVETLRKLNRKRIHRKRQFWSRKGSRVTKRKARKEHECGECYGTISPGEEYYEIAYKSDYLQWYTARVCVDCWD